MSTLSHEKNVQIDRNRLKHDTQKGRPTHRSRCAVVDFITRRQELSFLTSSVTGLTTFGATLDLLGSVSWSKLNICYSFIKRTIFRRDLLDLLAFISFKVACHIDFSLFTAEPYVEYPNFNVNYIFLHKEKELRYFFWQKRREGPFKWWIGNENKRKWKNPTATF